MLNLDNGEIYGQVNAPFVTNQELQSALDNVVTQEELQSALDNVVTQEDLNEKFYIVVGSQVTADVFPPHDLLTSDAECDDGDIVISGGFSLQGPSTDTFQRTASLSTNPLPDGAGWTSSILATSGASISTTALDFDNTT